jgi:RNA polymerase subunit RPABC4/transcription elongation factor Spt4
VSDLPPFSGDDTTCPKCGNEGASTQWIPRGFVSANGAPGECLERVCGRCAFVWAEATVEEKPALTKETK